MAKTKSRNWSPKKRAIALSLRSEGHTYEEIAQKIGGGADKSGVVRVCRKFLKFGQVTDLPKSGRKRISSAVDDRRMVRMVLKDRRLPSMEIANALNDSGLRISARTIRRRLFKAGLKAKTPRKKPYLNARQRQKRIQWAKEHSTWTVEQWGRVIFSDESKISLFGNDGVRYVRRRVREENNLQCIVPTMKHPVSVMIWGCMARGGVGRLKVLKGTVNARKYISDVLEPKLVRSVVDIFGPNNADYVFQQDGAPCHTAKICTKWFADNNIEVLSWPGNSPDLNPIENLW